MLAQKRRISKSTFKTFGRGVIFHSSTLSLALYKKPDETPSQFTFICSKKVNKSAVKRNLLRRRGYNAVQKLLSQIRPGFYCVFSFKKTPKQTTFSEIATTVLQLLTQAQAI